MMLNRNSYNSPREKSSLGIIFIITLILVIVIFGARDHIKREIKSYIGTQGVSKSEVEEIVKDYITNNPTVIISSLQEMQRKEEEEIMKKAQSMLKDNKDVLQSKNEEFALVAGNKEGDVVVTAFLDYRCGYCKSVNREIIDAINKDNKVKVVFKELPILGQQSINLSKLALAVYLIDNSKYYPFHNELMNAQSVDEKTLDAIYAKLSIEKVKVLELSESEKVKKELDSVAQLAGKIGLRGTPAFVIGEELLPGAVDSKTMLEKVSNIRKK